MNSKVNIAEVLSKIFPYFLFCAVVAGAASAWGASSVENLRDPLHPGSSLNLSFDDQFGTPGNLSTELQYAHTFDDSIAFQVGVPFILSEKNPAATTPVPRIGGGTDGRIFGGFTARFMGDEESYFDSVLNVGIPFLQAQAVQHTVNSTLVITGELVGHLKIKHFALEGRISDEDEFPVHYTAANGSQDYSDTQNHITLSALTYWYTNDRLDFFIHYIEALPFHDDRGTDNGESATIDSTSTTERSRVLGLGLDYAINPQNLLITLELRKTLEAPSRPVGSDAFVGALRWIF